LKSVHRVRRCCVVIALIAKALIPRTVAEAFPAEDAEMDSNRTMNFKNDNLEIQPIRIVIVDDHAVVREGISMLIESQDDMKVTAQAANFAEALAAVKREKPGIVVMDLDLGGINIVERLPEILSASAGTRVLVLTGLRDPQDRQRAVRCGAMGVVLKDQATDTLLKAIRKINAGEAWIDRSMTASLLSAIGSTAKERKDEREAAKIATISHREREIIKVLCEGLSNKQIANRLFISEPTVRNHITSILAKLELSDRFELAIYSYRHGLAEPPR